MLEKTIIIALDELKYAFKNKKALFILFVYIVMMCVGIKYGNLIGIAAKLLFINTKIDAAVLIPFYVSAVFIPLFTLLISYDSISGELYKNSIRYLAVRTSRLSIILGKYLAYFILTIGINLIMYFIVVVYNYNKTGNFSAVSALLVWFYLIFYSLCFLSIGFLSSTAAKKPQTSLWIGVIILVSMLWLYIKDYFVSLIPYQYINYIIKGNILVGIIALCVFAVILFGISILILTRRDL